MTQTLPTTDLYFLNSCRASVARWWRKGPIKRLGANSFRCGNRQLLIRRDKPDLMEEAIAGDHCLIYLIDDDLTGAASTPSLPSSYRARLTDFAQRFEARLLERASVIVTSSDALEAKFRSDQRIAAEIVRLDPFWAMPFADQKHFSASPNGRTDIAHLGTASHRGGLAQIAPYVIDILDRFPATHFTFIGAAGQHKRLEAHPRTHRVDVMSWPRYRRWLSRQRFHLALYPLEETTFDRARSANKLFEHAIVGAVGVYPRGWRPAAMAAGGAVLAPDNPDDWRQTLIDVMERRQSLAELAEIAVTSLQNRHNAEAQQLIWAKLLNLSLGARALG